MKASNEVRCGKDDFASGSVRTAAALAWGFLGVERFIRHVQQTADIGAFALLFFSGEQVGLRIRRVHQTTDTLQLSFPRGGFSVALGVVDAETHALVRCCANALS